MVADGLAKEAELAVLLVRLDQAEVGGAAADVDDETEIAGPDASGVLNGMRREPAIKCRLRLLEKGEVGEAGLASGVDGERAGHVVERRGYGEDDLLLLHRRCGMARVPGIDEMLQIARRRLDRRDAMDLRRGGPGEQRGGAIDAAVTEPRLRGGDEPAGNAGAVIAGELADDVPGGRIPRQRRRAGGKVVRPRQVQERGQQLPRGGFAGGDELRDAEVLDGAGGPLVEIDVRQGAVGGAEIDADEETHPCILRPTSRKRERRTGTTPR